MSTGSLERTDLDERNQPGKGAESGEGAEAPEAVGESAEVSSFTSTVPSRRIPARAPNGRFVGPGSQLPPEADDLPTDRYLERELSWLQFNERVMQLAMDPTIPLLERARFLAIFASNLDEYFMVRVAGLKRRIATGLAVRTAAGLEPRELIERVARLAHELMNQHAAIFQHEVRPALEEQGITIVRWDELDEEDQEPLHYFFAERVFPVLTPLAVDPAHPFPYISGLSLNLAVLLQNPKTGSEHFARVKVPPSLPRFIRVDEYLLDIPLDAPLDAVLDKDRERRRFVPLEDIIASHLDQLFPGMLVREHFSFRVTRNEDVEVEEDDTENLLTALEKELTRRRFGPPIRLEVEDDIDSKVLDMLSRELQISDREVYRLPTPLDLRGLFTIADVDRSDLAFPTFFPRTHPDFAPTESAKPIDLLAAVRQKDVLVQHPYNSFSTSVQAFIEQAAADPNVLAIKQTLYRTSGDSPIIDALIDAAEAGKQVLAVVEIKARFDEVNNISWARKLEEAGVHVVYGVVGLKTHAKLCLVVRQESDGLVRYCHIGTGNYNPKTARVYEDFGLFTCDPQVGEDLSRLFNLLSGFAPRSRFKRLLVAPRSVRSGLVELIEEEVALHEARGEAGPPGRIVFKANSIVDEELIDALYRASIAGVHVDIWVRGICAVRPGVTGLSEHIRVRSVLGRFLEHSRVFWFDHGGDPQVYIGSADLMHRNLDRRVEALVRITDPGHLEELRDLIDLGFAETTSRWDLGSDGRWVRHHQTELGEPLDDLQVKLMERHDKRRRKARRR
ncbi:polyphosphate kinase [Intrasporangium oryzae NRRL B-24470]|uniref:Polyphosphate kinase n=1 Tax=Intrasporangium oryzae NRRL B-24470 TaxID=1386089 RepID=W9G936_9MICO|nr:RNA degradosome polyphosphate kinase [Intrasporangium oryzae]EWT02530.1 polyphosphate kinase [Intrasporangium oryzae NRRL B-24470]